MGIYSQIKEQISTRDVAIHYGFKVNSHGMICCPFHDDKNPSMKVDQNFICFGCQEKGDVIRFASKLFNLTPYDAAMKLIEDMGLSVTLENKPENQSDVHQKEKLGWKQEQQFQKAVNWVYDVLCDYFHLLNRWADEFAPHSPNEDFNPLFIESVHNRDYMEYLLDLLIHGSRKDKASVLFDKVKEVDDLERRIGEIKSGERKCAARNDLALTAGDDDGRSGRSSGKERQGTGQESHHKRGDDPVI